MTSTGRLAAACLVLAAGSTAGIAHAQQSVDTGRITGAAGVDQDVIKFYAGANIEHHSNILRLAPGVDPTPSFGKSQRADTLLIGNLRATFDRDISLQRLKLDVRLTPTKYNTYSQFDNLGYNALAQLNWAVGSALYGDVGANFAQVQTSFIGTTGTGVSFGGDKNLERRNKVFGTAGLRLTPNWSVFGHLDHENLSNSLNQPAFQAANYSVTGTEAGVRFEPGTGTELSFLGRHDKASYDNLQTVDVFGTPIATPISNDYKQNAALIRLLVRPSQESVISGQVGLTKRDYDSVGSRNFSGPTAGVNMDWRLGPGFLMGLDVYRNLFSANILTANYVDITGIRLRPTFNLTGKINLNPNIGYEHVAWKGDPGLATNTTGERKDNMTYLGLQLQYQYSRVLSMTADLRRENRTSNYDQFKFSNNIIGVGILAAF